MTQQPGEFPNRVDDELSVLITDGEQRNADELRLAEEMERFRSLLDDKGVNLGPAGTPAFYFGSDHDLGPGLDLSENDRLHQSCLTQLANTVIAQQRDGRANPRQAQSMNAYHKNQLKAFLVAMGAADAWIEVVDEHVEGKVLPIDQLRVAELKEMLQLYHSMYEQDKQDALSILGYKDEKDIGENLERLFINIRVAKNKITVGVSSSESQIESIRAQMMSAGVWDDPNWRALFTNWF